MEQHGIALQNLFDVRKIFSLFEYTPFTKGLLWKEEVFPFWELIWVRKGSAVYRVAQNTVVLPQGSIAVLPPDIPHSCQDAMKDTLLFYLSFQCVGNTIFHLSSRPMLLTKEEETLLAQIARKKTAFRWPGEICSGGAMQLSGDMPVSMLAALKLQTESLLMLLEENHPAPVALHDSTRNRINTRLFHLALEEMEAHLDGTITPDGLADTLHITVSALRKLFHACTGFGVLEYYNNLRIEKAKQYLAQGELNITQIADALGYSSPFYFSRVFKTATGVSPSAYGKGK